MAGPPSGVEGYIRIHSLSGETAHLAALARVAVRRADGGEAALEIERVRENGAGFFIKFKGIDTPEDARKWSGAEILVSREEAAPLGSGEYYIEDLKGLSLCGEDGATLGVVGDVIEGGGASLLKRVLRRARRGLFRFVTSLSAKLTLPGVAPCCAPCGF